MPATPAVMLKVTVVPSTELLVAMKLFVGAIVESPMGRAAVGIWKAVLGAGVVIKLFRPRRFSIGQLIAISNIRCLVALRTCSVLPNCALSDACRINIVWLLVCINRSEC